MYLYAACYFSRTMYGLFTIMYKTDVIHLMKGIRLDDTPYLHNLFAWWRSCKLDTVGSSLVTSQVTSNRNTHTHTHTWSRSVTEDCRICCHLLSWAWWNCRWSCKTWAHSPAVWGKGLRRGGEEEALKWVKKEKGARRDGERIRHSSKLLNVFKPAIVDL